MDQQEILESVERLQKTAVAHITDLQDENTALKEKIAQYETDNELLRRAVTKAANEMVRTQYLSEERRNSFIKDALAKPAKLAETIERLCGAAEVSTIGQPGNVKAASAYQNDPVSAKAFGQRNEERLLCDE
jgi:TolA-binding protein